MSPFAFLGKERFEPLNELLIAPGQNRLWTRYRVTYRQMLTRVWKQPLCCSQMLMPLPIELNTAPMSGGRLKPKAKATLRIAPFSPSARTQRENSSSVGGASPEQGFENDITSVTRQHFLWDASSESVSRRLPVSTSNASGPNPARYKVRDCGHETAVAHIQAWR